MGEGRIRCVSVYMGAMEEVLRWAIDQVYDMNWVR